MTSVTVGRHTIEITKPDKVLFPDPGFTKADLVDYYRSIAPVMLPHVRDRLMTLERFPDGIDGEKFYSKNIPRYFPDWVDRETVAKEGRDRYPHRLQQRSDPGLSGPTGGHHAARQLATGRQARLPRPAHA